MALTRQISHEPPQIPSRSGRQCRSHTRRNVAGLSAARSNQARDTGGDRRFHERLDESVTWLLFLALLSGGEVERLTKLVAQSGRVVEITIRNITFDDLQPILSFKAAIVAKGANGYVA